MKQPKIIAINNTFVYIEQGKNYLQNLIINTDVIQDHPDQNKMENAEILLNDLLGKKIFTPEVEAIIEYGNAYENISKYSEPEFQDKMLYVKNLTDEEELDNKNLTELQYLSQLVNEAIERKK